MPLREIIGERERGEKFEREWDRWDVPYLGEWHIDIQAYKVGVLPEGAS